MLSASGYPSPFYYTFNQVKALNGRVKKDEHGNMVVFWKFFKASKNEEGGEELTSRGGAMLRYYYVFNHSQTEGIAAPEVEVHEVNPNGRAVEIIRNYLFERGPEVEYSPTNKACYSPLRDKVFMPSPEYFGNTEDFHQVMFHELTHSTGHEARLNRLEDGSLNHGGKGYAKEELTAEMGAAFLSAECGLDCGLNPEQSAAYIASWLQALRNDKGLVVRAAGLAHKASNFILGEGAVDNE
jgi:antirestriction protein ArdC